MTSNLRTTSPDKPLFPMDDTHEESAKNTFAINTHISMEKQLEWIVKRDRCVGGESPMIFMNAELWELHLTGLPVRNIAHDYVTTMESMTNHGGDRVFEVLSGGTAATSPLFKYPSYIDKYMTDKAIHDSVDRIVIFFAPKDESSDKRWLTVHLICNELGFLGDLYHIPVHATVTTPADTVTLIETVTSQGHVLVDIDGELLTLSDVRNRYNL